MSSQEDSFPSQQPQQHHQQLSRQTAAFRDLESVEQRSQQHDTLHESPSEGERNMAVVAEHRTLPDFATNFGSYKVDPIFREALFERPHDSEHSPAKEREADAQNCPIIDGPALGQICR